MTSDFSATLSAQTMRPKISKLIKIADEIDAAAQTLPNHPEAGGRGLKLSGEPSVYCDDKICLVRYSDGNKTYELRIRRSKWMHIKIQ